MVINLWVGFGFAAIDSVGRFFIIEMHFMNEALKIFLIESSTLLMPKIRVLFDK